MYIATIRKVGNEFIAFDSDGNWRARGNADKAPATKGRKLATYLFHSEECGSVKVLGGKLNPTTCVEVLP